MEKKFHSKKNLSFVTLFNKVENKVYKLAPSTRILFIKIKGFFKKKFG